MINPACSAFLLLYDNCIAKFAAVLTSTGAFFSAWCSAILQAPRSKDRAQSFSQGHNSRRVCAHNFCAALLLYYARYTAGKCSCARCFLPQLLLSGVLQGLCCVQRVVNMHEVQ
jgi:hypothetical protein